MEISYFILVILASFGVSSCNGDARIVGGEPIDIREAPYQVAISVRIMDTYYLKCGGALINSTLVITSGSCLHDQAGKLLPASALRVYAGTTYLHKLDKYVDVNYTVVHENYTFVKNGPLYSDDIGLVQLVKPFELSSQIAIIDMTNTAVPEGKNCTLTGWGSVAENQPPRLQLRTATVPIYSKRTCDRKYYMTPTVRHLPGFVCAGYKDHCMYYTGSPLVCDGLLIGILSFGQGCGNPDYPGVYTDIAFHHDWIEENWMTGGAHSHSSPFILTLIIPIISHIIVK